MVSILKSCNSRIRKVNSRQLVVGLSMLCIVISLSLIQRSSIRKHEMLKHSQSCGCIHENQDMNLLHSIPLLLFPALETSETEQLSVTNQQNCFAPVKDKRKHGDSNPTALFPVFGCKLENNIYQYANALTQCSKVTLR